MEEHAAEDIKHIPPTTVRLLPPDLCPSASRTGAMPRSGEASRALQKKRREEQIGPRRKRGRPARAQAQEEDTALAMCAAAGTL